MVKSAKSLLEEEVYEDKELHATNYTSSQNAQEDARGAGQQGTTPRSKHSATEQRRRCKINERFQILRDIIPQNDQKRDKASFLLEVIEYIQFLQEKLHMYEGTYQAWTQEPAKLMPWRNNHMAMEDYVDHSPVITNGSAHEHNVASPIITNTQNLVESDPSIDAAYRVVENFHGPATQTAPLNVPLQSNMLSPGGKDGVLMHQLKGSTCDTEHIVGDPHCQLDGKSCAPVCAAPRIPANEQGITTENSTGIISSVYSQGVLHSLTEALQSSGVDISQASISVQIDVGKQNNVGLTALASGSQDNSPSVNNCVMTHSLVGSGNEHLDHAFKRLRREKC